MYRRLAIRAVFTLMLAALMLTIAMTAIDTNIASAETSPKQARLKQNSPSDQTSEFCECRGDDGTKTTCCKVGVPKVELSPTDKASTNKVLNVPKNLRDAQRERQIDQQSVEKQEEVQR